MKDDIPVQFIVVHEYYYLQQYHEYGQSGWRKAGHEEFESLEKAVARVKALETDDKRRNARIYRAFP